MAISVSLVPSQWAEINPGISESTRALKSSKVSTLVVF
jgi:hypothetical protein